MVDRKTVLFMSINYAPEPSGTAPYTTSAAEHLAQRGHDVVVVAGMPHYPDWRVSPGYSGVRKVEETLSGVTVRRRSHYVPVSQSARHRMRYEVSFALRSLTALRGPEPDVVVAVIPSLLGAIVAALAARVSRAELVLWVQDSVHRASAQSGIATGRLLPRLLGVVENHLLRRADRVIAISDEFEQQMRGSGVHPGRLVVMRNWSFIPQAARSASETRRRFGWSDEETVVVHAGNMGKKQGLSALVEAARISGSQAKPPRFVLVGEGSQRRALQAMAADVPALQFVGTLGNQEYADVLAAADVLLVCEARGVVDMSLPSKLTSYMAIGRPIVAYVDPGGGTAKELRRSGAGLVVDNRQSPRLLVEALNQLAMEPSTGKALAQAGRRHAREAYCQRRNLGVLVEVVEGS